jgi:hypothetical protein
MKHFLKIADGIDTIPVLHSLKMNEGLWDENNLRTTHENSAHKEASDIWLMFNDVGQAEYVANDIQVRPYRAWDSLPIARSIVLGLMARLCGIQLGRVIITRLKPGAKITPHIDQGAPATFYSRYQVALQSLPGANFRIEDEVVNFRSGEIWWINNRAEHEVINNSADDRIVMIVDIRC